MHPAAPRNRVGACVGMGLWAALGAATAAPTLSTTPDATLSAPEPAQGDTNKLAESTSRAVRKITAWLARGVDSGLGDQPF